MDLHSPHKRLLQREQNRRITQTTTLWNFTFFRDTTERQPLYICAFLRTSTNTGLILSFKLRKLKKKKLNK